MRAALLLSSKKLAEIKENKIVHLKITKEGENYAKNLLPELRLLKVLQEKETISISELLDKSKIDKKESKIALGWLMRNKWAKKEKENLHITDEGRKIDIDTYPPQVFLKELAEKKEIVAKDDSLIDIFRKRKKVLDISEKIERYIILTENIKLNEIKTKDKITQITSDVIKSKKWEKAEIKRYNISDEVKKSYPGKFHPLRYLMEKVRNIFIEMGFSEVEGPIIESSFWNFDALFQPQDHPARDLADTFYLKDFELGCEDREILENVKKTHQDGGKTGSTGWGYKWSEKSSKRPVLRTHTTAVSARSLRKFKPPAKVFTIGSTFRNESIDYKHLTEFRQVEGIVVDDSVNFENLLGYLKEFYRRLGFRKVRFRPAYFPYTYCSVEPEVYFEDKGEWIELGGSGIFRPEVVEPFGLDCPVLAWGLSLERPVMLMLEMDDIREFYKNDLNWLRAVKPSKLNLY